MSRVAFPLVLQSPVTGSAIVGAKATITKHQAGVALGAGEPAEVFTSETEASKVSNVIVSDNTGRWTQGEGTGYLQYWLPEGTYDIAISGTGITTVVVTRELASGNTLAASVVAGSKAWQPGVILTTDWNFTGTINGGSAAISPVAATGGTAWIEVGGALIYTTTPNAVFGPLGPPALPASGKFISIGVQLKPETVFGGHAAVSLVAGTEKTTEAEALAAPAGAVAGAVRVRDLIVKNTAGVYSIVAERDRRPWARGIYFAANLTGAELNSTPSEQTLLSRRFEFSAPATTVHFTGNYEINPGTGTQWMNVALLVDGVLRATWQVQTQAKESRMLSGVKCFFPAEVPVGSHLLSIVMHNDTASLGGTTTRMILSAPNLVVRESRYGNGEPTNGTT